MQLKPRSLGLVLLGVVAIGALAYVGVSHTVETRSAQSEQEAAKGPSTLVGMRRLTEQQYRNTIADVFGRKIAVVGRFDPLLRTEGLIGLGAGNARITPSGFQQYYDMARNIAAQVVNEANRGQLISCKPKDPTAADNECASAYFASVGRFLYRRPLEAEEVQVAVKAAESVAAVEHSFYAGIAEGLTTMLVSPRFLYVLENAQPDKSQPNTAMLSAYSKASKLSFLLWNTTPDEVLLDAAGRGELATSDGLARQVDRMIASPRIEQGVRAFASDFLGFDAFANLEKDSEIYPAYVPKVGRDAEEQMLLTIVDHLVVQNADYRDLFTTRKTFMTGSLARLYRTPVSRPDGLWEPYEFPPDDPHGAGILSLMGFLSLNSHPGISSPTLRGKAIRERFLCQHVPDPPGDVDFSNFTDPKSPNLTARDRLTAHRSNATCAGCHKITDPIGLSLERFDGAGQARTAENGAKIEVAGDLDGVNYTDEAGLGKAMRSNPAVPTCVVNRLFQYALGHPFDKNDRQTATLLEKAFEKDGYKVPALLKRITRDENFFRVTLNPENRVAEAQSAVSVPVQ